MTNPTNPNVKILDNLCVIHLDFDIWSGQAKLSPSDIRGSDVEIPPERLANLGTKRVCSPDELKPFARLKTEARRLLLRHGMPFMNGFAVPASKAEEILQEVERIAEEFNELKNNFLANYEQALDEWCLENQEYEASIRASALSLEEIEKRIDVDYQAFLVKPVDDINAGKLTRKVERLGDDLINEIADTANEFYLKHLAFKTECGINTKMTLINMRNKIEGLSFLNSAFNALVSMLDKVIVGYETGSEGRNIVAPFIYELSAAVLVLSDKDKIEALADGRITVESEAEKLKPAPEPEPEVEVIVADETISVSEEQSEATVVESFEDDFDDLDAFFEQKKAEAERLEKEKAEYERVASSSAEESCFF